MARLNFSSDQIECSTNKVGGGSINNSSTSTEYVSAKALNDILSAMFPIGYVLTTFDTADYTNYMGYTWERLQNTFLYADGTWSVGDVGGEATHILTGSEIPPHTHPFINTKKYSVKAGGYTSPAFGDGVESTQLTTGVSGDGLPHNNMPPYTVVRMWKRVS